MICSCFRVKVNSHDPSAGYSGKCSVHGVFLWEGPFLLTIGRAALARKYVMTLARTIPLAVAKSDQEGSIMSEDIVATSAAVLKSRQDRSLDMRTSLQPTGN